jgi:hypothetical protein
MGLGHGTNIASTKNLVFAYDMGNTLKSWKGKPTTNTINALTTSISRYNNPGFSGSVFNTGQTFKGMPIFETVFIPQNSTFIPRLASTEGFGALHGMGISLLADTRYMASIYVKPLSSLQNSASQGFSNGYSNISGWNQNNTSTTRYEEDGWIRLYSQYYNNTNGYSTRSSTFQVNFVVNTTSTQTVDVNFTLQPNGSGISDFSTLYAIVGANPTIANNGGLSGLSISNHGLNTDSFTKLSWPNEIKLKATDLPFNYFVRLSVPSTGGSNVTIALRANFTGYYTAISDGKYWKITFDTAGATEGQEFRAQWCCPMIEQSDTLYPSTFVNGTRSNNESILDLTGSNFITSNNLSYTNTGIFNFSNSSLTAPNSNLINFSGNKKYTALAWIYPTGSGGTWHGVVSKGNSQQYALTLNVPNRYLHYETNQGGVGALNSANNSIDLNTWQLVGIRFDGTNKTIWKNGVQIASQAASSLNSSSNTEDLRIGEGNNGELFLGSIPQVYIYDRDFSNLEMLQTFNALRGRYGI